MGGALTIGRRSAASALPQVIAPRAISATPIRRTFDITSPPHGLMFTAKPRSAAAAIIHRCRYPELDTGGGDRARIFGGALPTHHAIAGAPVSISGCNRRGNSPPGRM